MKQSTALPFFIILQGEILTDCYLSSVSMVQVRALQILLLGATLVYNGFTLMSLLVTGVKKKLEIVMTFE